MGPVTRLPLIFLLLVAGPRTIQAAHTGARCEPLQWGVYQTEMQRAYRAQTEINSVFLGFKTQAEASYYFECYQPTEDPIAADNFTEHYEAMIRKAADSYGIPFSVLASLFYRESSYWRGTSSSVGARGMGQLMPGTLPTLNLMFENPSHPLKEIWGKATQLILLSRTKTLTDQQRKNLAFYRARIKVETQFRLVRHGWQAYWHERHPPALTERALAMDGSSKSEQNACNHPSKPCAAELGIAAGAALLKYYSLLLGTPECDGDHWLIAVGSYNLGSGAMAHYLKPGIKADEVIDKLYADGNKETARHIQSIQNCAKRGSLEPMRGSQKKTKAECDAKQHNAKGSNAR